VFRFNDELLLSTIDRDLAAEAFPDVFFALDDPALRSDFKRLDTEANKKKAHSRLIGQAALVLAVASLLTFPLEPAISLLIGNGGESSSMFRIFALLGALCGVLAIVFGNIGLGFGKAKRGWLRSRLATERLRQWHAQYIIAHAADIAAAVGDQARQTEFQAARKIAYERFRRGFLSQIASEYSKYTQRNSAGHLSIYTIAELDAKAFWIEPAWGAAIERETAAANRPALQQLLDAYAATRIQGQVQYTNYILSDHGRFWSHPATQLRILGNTSFMLVMLAFLANLLALAIALWGPFEQAGTALGSIGMTLAILSVGSRALQEALHPHEELQRMERYAAKVGYAKRQFETAGTPAEALAAAVVLERASTDEMLDFLAINENARFVL